MEIRADIHLTSPRSQVSRLDDLPFVDRSLVDYEKYNRFIGQAMVKNCLSLMATRGCPYKCAYCHKIWPKRHYARSAENIIQEIQIYYDMGIRRYSFVDDIFNLDKKNSSRFFELIIRQGIDVQLFFPGGFRGDILSLDYIDLLVEAGTVNVALALETASPRLQKFMGKGLNIERFRENIEYFCQKYPQVILELFTIMGFPTETEEEAVMTLDFIKSLKWIHFIYANILKIFPHTDMEKLALENGISRQAIFTSMNLAYDEIPETIPFSKAFARWHQAELLHKYILQRERLMAVLPYQTKILTEDEIVQKYNSFLPGNIASLDDLQKYLGISPTELRAEACRRESDFYVSGLNQKTARYFGAPEPQPGALKILLLDLSHFFSNDRCILYEVFEPPLGLMYLMSYLKQKLGDKVVGKIAESRMDFDNEEELKALLNEFNPDIIGVRSLTLFKKFFHKMVERIRGWKKDVPIIAGGPYATSEYSTILLDLNIDLVVLGEGEITFCALITAIIDNGGKLPGIDVLKGIDGIAFVPGLNKSPGRQPGVLSHFNDDLENE